MKSLEDFRIGMTELIADTRVQVKVADTGSSGLLITPVSREGIPDHIEGFLQGKGFKVTSGPTFIFVPEAQDGVAHRA